MKSQGARAEALTFDGLRGIPIVLSDGEISWSGSAQTALTKFITPFACKLEAYINVRTIGTVATSGTISIGTAGATGDILSLYSWYPATGLVKIPAASFTTQNVDAGTLVTLNCSSWQSSGGAAIGVIITLDPNARTTTV